MRKKTHNEINKTTRHGSIQFLYVPFTAILRIRLTIFIYIFAAFFRYVDCLIFFTFLCLFCFPLPVFLPFQRSLCCGFFEFQLGETESNLIESYYLLPIHSKISFIQCMTHSKLFVWNIIYISKVNASAQHSFFLCAFFFLRLSVVLQYAINI